AAFDIHDINKAASAFNPEKLLWLNQQHMVRARPADLVPHFRYQLLRIGLECDNDALLEGVILAQRERAKTMKEMAQNSRFFFVEEAELDPKAVAKNLGTEQKPLLAELHQRLAALTDWSAAGVHELLTTFATEKGLGLGKIAQPLRVAVTGGT